jgi:hypothetical protein
MAMRLRQVVIFSILGVVSLCGVSYAGASWNHVQITNVELDTNGDVKVLTSVKPMYFSLSGASATDLVTQVKMQWVQLLLNSMRTSGGGNVWLNFDISSGPKVEIHGVAEGSAQPQ